MNETTWTHREARWFSSYDPWDYDARGHHFVRRQPSRARLAADRVRQALARVARAIRPGHWASASSAPLTGGEWAST